MIPINEEKTLGLIPARGGSKSLRLKNIHPLCGKPLISYCIAAAKHAMQSSLGGLACSTDHPDIAACCKKYGVTVIDRPAELATDESLTEEAVVHALHVLQQQDGEAPGIIVLLQPTSPFVLPEHIDGLVKLLKKDKSLDTALTIADIPHNLHAWNQRSFENGHVRFRYEKERQAAYNKQLKPKNYRFGNLVAFRASSILSGNRCFGLNQAGLVIERPYAHDVDGPEDFAYAEFLIERQLVHIPDDIT